MAMSHRRRLAAAGLVALAATAPAAARAQNAGDGFLFHRPVGGFVLRGGFASETASGDLYSFLTDQFTLDKGDFRAPSFGADALVTVAPRLDLVFGAGYSGWKRDSEFRDFIGTDNLPIAQTTRLERVPLTAGVRFYLTSPGRSIGRYAWIPNKLVPYVGAGGGMMWYRLRQSGEFIDFTTSDVFPDEFASSGWTGTAHVMTGANYSLGPRFALNGEARYTHAKSSLGTDFTGFDGIDLSDFAFTLGLNVRF
jgi:Outer membrane protein beta-barrel domain